MGTPQGFEARTGPKVSPGSTVGSSRRVASGWVDEIESGKKMVWRMVSCFTSRERGQPRRRAWRIEQLNHGQAKAEYLSHVEDRARRIKFGRVEPSKVEVRYWLLDPCRGGESFHNGRRRCVVPPTTTGNL
ncbi:uncharacterized protein VDAG_04351 [Verticillium dahliae VdLs.17]|uniref:Uncharacterized protein n=1 Tax=Verticillium dahliae (strain VdLs.17 / ATCC MYA-4575 / FGSC 10137) TaxID=498257 RepID=G2X227_VERDV|nr:uncharacterized protein VDAG_04351 [Verticillium dahliae VdLs.17]EGY22913.1 hypothetical protein VDAG_04351 [Verticillium dahliae VdLs.17]KAH6700305.1 hypothetical protein EV126DRAFT_422444 [Verticillium dahliae]